MAGDKLPPYKYGTSRGAKKKIYAYLFQTYPHTTALLFDAMPVKAGIQDPSDIENGPDSRPRSGPRTSFRGNHIISNHLI